MSEDSTETEDQLLTAVNSFTSWQDRANEVAAWLPTASREALMRFAWRHFQRAESAAWCIAEEHRRADCAAQRQASHAIAGALDWSAQSRRPSHDELVRRRAVIA